MVLNSARLAQLAVPSLSKHKLTLATMTIFNKRRDHLEFIFGYWIQPPPYEEIYSFGTAVLQRENVIEVLKGTRTE